VALASLAIMTEDYRHHASNHPLIATRVARLRDAATSDEAFRRLVDEITTFLAYEAFGGLSVTSVPITTPVAPTQGVQLAEVPVVVPILRAGLGMAATVQRVVGASRLCLLGLRRNETTLEPETYLNGLPADLRGETVVLCDPMLATGGSLCHALSLVEERGATSIVVLCLLAAVPGLERVMTAFPTISLTVAAIDPELNDHGYIVPGLGDAGDRQFGAPVW